ncbi:MAG: bifunctional methylenetetrahydrofolate dehydrogenase/methenyltetrahydrofolate cyclohydrolase FolD [Chlorobi bacterium]|nr:MAG: bifunctional methylenetetrahydrofolate dehydrogenase/methenyltetrahydrofolate cyclohydrolase FolD [Bacteroidota bacterium]KXK33887.1 MAG: methenyltetrahydrofolate cyclohydrolase [Chlorobi bacterium OLB6]MBL1161494.1 bifunctional methylenetetrahydrofolate dehydrogenase/methenyltetrahydrofolate cyclohydrolase FolD [Chlorobiota bacterium]MBW7854096.1 bifunctional methylenetetrahydrofolate dehydrogenase/methenyltetrahydrofolate cyclohydrolase FolD [Candidatus Kapabacteria bacterium]MCC63307
MAAEIRSEVAGEVRMLAPLLGRSPGLHLLLVGNDAASEVYVRNKARDCEQVGIRSVVERMPTDTSQERVLAIIAEWNSNPAVDGILVQLPLPPHINEHAVIEAISPEKDVDGFHPMNAGRLLIGQKGFAPCTPAGIMEMLRRGNIEVAGKHAVVVGRSNIVGKPMSVLLARKAALGNATVTMCHTGTPDIAKFTIDADIIIAAVGRVNTITARHVKPGAVIIDVGMNRIVAADGRERLTGDVDYETVAPLAGAITPVPGGVGPMTRAMLLVNTLQAAQQSIEGGR